MSGPHDRLFRYAHAPPAQAEALLRYNLPADITAAVDWSTFRREFDTLAEVERDTRDDLIFSARLHNSAEDDPPLFFIIEHQSSVDPNMAPRAFDYCARLIHHWRESHPHSKRIPQVIVLVVYAQRGRSWSAPRRLEEHYAVPEAVRGPHRFSVRFEYLVDDLPTQEDTRVLARPGPPLGPLVLLVLSYASTPELAERLEHWRELFARVYAAPFGKWALYRLLYYLRKFIDEQAYMALKRMLHSFLAPIIAEALMQSIEAVLLERGRKQGEARGEARGRAEGKAEGKAESLLRLLASRGIPLDEPSRQLILGCKDVDTLERWFDRALSASQLSDVLS